MKPDVLQLKNLLDWSDKMYSFLVDSNEHNKYKLAKDPRRLTAKEK